MIIHHQRSMLFFDGRGVRSFSYSQYQLCLSSVHDGVEASGVHPEGVDVLLLADVSVELGACSDGWINGEVLRPAAMSQRPMMVLMVGIV